MTTSQRHATSVNFKERFYYCEGQIAEGVFSATVSIFLLFYYTQVLGLSGTLCGIALFIALCFDAITDPLIGTLSDGWRSKWGRRHPFMLAAPIPLALAFVGLFNPLVDSEFGLFMWLTVFAILSRGSMTLYHIPHLALAAEMTQDFDGRTRLVALRAAFGSSGMMLAYGTAFLVFFQATEQYPNGQLNPAAYLPLSITMGIVIAVTIISSAMGTMSLVPNLPQPAFSSKGYSLVDSLLDVRRALANESFRWLVVGFIVVLGAAGVAASLSMHIKTFFWELTPKQLPIILAAGTFGTLAGFMVAGKLGEHLEKRSTLMLGAAGWGFIQLVLIVTKLTGFFPMSPTALMPILVTATFVQSVFGAQVFVSCASMLADITDEHELDTGKRQEGIFFGAFSFSTKAAQGLGVAIGGIVLDLVGWPSNQSVRTAADIPPETIESLALIFGPVLGLLMIPAVMFVSRYRLTRERHRYILTELAS